MRPYYALELVPDPPAELVDMFKGWTIAGAYAHRDGKAKPLWHRIVAAGNEELAKANVSGGQGR